MSQLTFIDPPASEEVVASRRKLDYASDIPCAVEIGRESAGSKIYYGWYMLLMAMGAAIASSPGQTFGVTIFNEPLRIELGFTHSQLALAYMLGTLLGAVPIYGIGCLMDRHGLRKTILTAIFLFSLACVAMSLVQNWLQVVLAFTFLRMLGPGALALLSGNVLPFWFAQRLGTVEGFRQTAMALAMAMVPPLNLWLVASFGWRSAFAILGSGIFAILFPAYWRFFRQNPGEVNQRIDGMARSKVATRINAIEFANAAAESISESESQQPQFPFRHILRSRAFWLVLAGTSLFSMIQTGVFFCLIPIFAEHGWSERLAASMLVVYAVSLACHQVMGGWLSDRLEARYQLIVGMLLFACGLFLLRLGVSSTLAIVAGALLGSAQGIYFASAQPLWTRFYGVLNLGKLRGFLMATNVAASSLGPLLVGLGRDHLGGFGPVLLFFSALPLVFALSSCWVTRPTLQVSSFED